MKSLSRISSLFLLLAAAAGASAAAVDAALQAKIDARVKDFQAWAADPVIVEAVKAQNAAPPASHAGLDQAKWKELTVLDPLIRGFTRNPVAELIKARKDDAVSEAFVSSANGTKVAFLAKTTSWSHQSSAKHADPMKGKTWQGEVEKDDSTGLEQIQVGVPVLDGGKPIGSLVIGLSLSKLGGS